MASYLVVENGEIPVIHEAEADSVFKLIEELADSIGDKVTVYRVAGKRKVTRHSETVQRIVIE